MGAAVNIFAHCPGWYVVMMHVSKPPAKIILFYFILFYFLKSRHWDLQNRPSANTKRRSERKVPLAKSKV